MPVTTTQLLIHRVAKINVDRVHYPAEDNHAAFTVMSVSFTDSADNQVTVKAFSVEPLTITDPDAPGADPGYTDIDAGLIPASVLALEAELMAAPDPNAPKIGDRFDWYGTPITVTSLRKFSVIVAPDNPLNFPSRVSYDEFARQARPVTEDVPTDFATPILPDYGDTGHHHPDDRPPIPGDDSDSDKFTAARKLRPDHLDDDDDRDPSICPACDGTGNGAGRYSPNPEYNTLDGCEDCEGTGKRIPAPELSYTGLSGLIDDLDLTGQVTELHGTIGRLSELGDTLAKQRANRSRPFFRTAADRADCADAEYDSHEGPL